MERVDRSDVGPKPTGPMIPRGKFRVKLDLAKVDGRRRHVGHPDVRNKIGAHSAVATAFSNRSSMYANPLLAAYGA